MSIKFLVLGGGYFGFWGGIARFYFYGREDFSERCKKKVARVNFYLGGFGGQKVSPVLDATFLLTSGSFLLTMESFYFLIFPPRLSLRIKGFTAVLVQK